MRWRAASEMLASSFCAIGRVWNVKRASERQTAPAGGRRVAGRWRYLLALKKSAAGTACEGSIWLARARGARISTLGPDRCMGRKEAVLF